MIAMAPLGARLHGVVFVERGGERRIVSARNANSREVDVDESVVIEARRRWVPCDRARSSGLHVGRRNAEEAARNVDDAIACRVEEAKTLCRAIPRSGSPDVIGR